MASYKKGSVTVCFLHSNAGILVLYFVLLKSSLFIDFSKVFLGGRVLIITLLLYCTFFNTCFF
jgi:hypothetical protein